jgi:uncharacterized protein YndB with AHSA1/START domain
MKKPIVLACSFASLLACAAPEGAAQPTDSESPVVQGTSQELDSLEPRVPGKHSVVFAAEAVIDADAADVWEAITDFEAYPDWNPWVLSAVGPNAPGSEVDVVVMNGKSKMNAKHTVLNGVPLQRFCWKDAGWNALFVYGQRCRTLTVQGDGSVHYQVELMIDGALSHIAALFYGPGIEEGIAKETAALALRAEALAARNVP